MHVIAERAAVPTVTKVKVPYSLAISVALKL
jgi:hypothetical protein